MNSGRTFWNLALALVMLIGLVFVPSAAAAGRQNLTSKEAEMHAARTQKWQATWGIVLVCALVCMGVVLSSWMVWTSGGAPAQQQTRPGASPKQHVVQEQVAAQNTGQAAQTAAAERMLLHAALSPPAGRALGASYQRFYAQEPAGCTSRVRASRMHHPYRHFYATAGSLAAPDACGW